LNWDTAAKDYKNCDHDDDFIDTICSVNAIRVEILSVNYAAAKTDLDKLLSNYPTNHNVLTEGIFLELLLENPSEADRLHEVLESTAQRSENSTNCIYYYARDQPKLASSYCEAAIHENETDYGRGRTPDMWHWTTSTFQLHCPILGKLPNSSTLQKISIQSPRN